MFTGVDLDKAIDFWKKGKEVLVLDRSMKSSAGGYEAYPLGELFRNLEFLADVPAVENPEFRQEVEDMIQESGSENTDRFLEIRMVGRSLAEGVKDAIEKNAEDTETPPPSRGRRGKKLRPENKKGVSPGAVC